MGGCSFELERQIRDEGYREIAGVDEAGRGPLAGPVVAVACMLPYDSPSFSTEGIDDSKKLTPQERKVVYERLVSDPGVFFGIGMIDHETIDTLNILRATLRAMSVAVERLSKRPRFLLVDGNKMPDTDIPGRAVVKGDGCSLSVAAASVIAKHVRDEIMWRYHLRWPEYGFDKHKGYPTRKHREAIRTHGPSPIHRRSFVPVSSS
ncbi:MAG: ribonuclease HII [Simkaniaceae bacterium]|nr:ribonuclease HII [Simkaniaceae bacterium]